MNKKVDIKDIQMGDVFSESSHYVFLGKENNKNHFSHVESKKTVTLDDKYVEELLVTADQYFTEQKIGKEDKKDGTLGIRSLFENITTDEVFTVCFKKADKDLSKKAYEEAKTKQITDALAKIEKAQKGKTGVTEEAKKLLKEIQNNPVLPYTEGEERVLKGYKVQFSSRDGRYDCFDMDFPDGPTGANVRPVNINSLVFLVYKGVKYVVE